MRAVRPARGARVATAVFALLLGATTSVHGQYRVLARQGPAVLDQRFSVGDARGDRDAVEFAVDRQGMIKVQAIWTGSARNLAMVLNGPGRPATTPARTVAAP